MNKIEKMAAKDAYRLASAEMAFGEGAGTARKLINAEIDQKLLTYADTDYNDLLRLEYELLDRGKLAKKAIQNRKVLDLSAKAGQNFRAVKSGNLNNATTGVAVIIGIYMVAKKTGYDKVVEAKAKEFYKKAKTEVKYRRLRAQGKNVEKI